MGTSRTALSTLLDGGLSYQRPLQRVARPNASREFQPSAHAAATTGRSRSTGTLRHFQSRMPAEPVVQSARCEPASRRLARYLVTPCCVSWATIGSWSCSRTAARTPRGFLQDWKRATISTRYARSSLLHWMNMSFGPKMSNLLEPGSCARTFPRKPLQLGTGCVSWSRTYRIGSKTNVRARSCPRSSTQP